MGESDQIVFYPKPRMRRLQNIGVMKNLISSLREFQPDVVHLLAYYPWLTPFARELAQYKMILTVHDPRKHTGDFASKIVPGSEKYFYGQASRIITLGHQMRNEIIRSEDIPPHKIAVIRHGNYNIYRDWIRPGATEQDPAVLFFGRLYAYKGLEYLIQAEPLVSREVPDVKFVIAGDGQNRYARKILHAIEGSRRFQVHNGYISDEQAAQLFQEASILVLPYIDASQSGPLMMSYAFKKPVIATRVGSLPEYVDHGHTGYLVPPANPAALAEKINTLLRNKKLRQVMGQAGYEKSISEYAWEKIAQETLDVYHQVFK